MASISTTLELTDRVSSVMYGIIDAVQSGNSAFEKMEYNANKAFDGSNFNNARAAIYETAYSVNDIEKNIRASENAQQSFNNNIQSGLQGFENMLGKVMKFANAPGIGEFVKQMATEMYGSAAELEATEVKFNTAFNGMTDVAQEFIDDFQTLTPSTESATRSMALGIYDVLAPMGFCKEEAVNMTAETLHLIGALTNFNSSTKTAEDVAGAFQSALNGEYQSLREFGIGVNDTIVKQRAVEMGLAATTDQVGATEKAQALLSLAYEQSGDALANYNEESLSTITRMGILQSSFYDTFAEAGQSMLPKISEFLQKIQTIMPGIETAIYGFASSLGWVINMANLLFDVAIQIGSFISDNWSIIEPIVMGIATAVGAYLLATKSLALAQFAGGLIMFAYNAVQTFLSIGFGILTGNTAAASAAMVTYNNALLASPLTWIILIIIIIISLFYSLVAVINKFAGTSISATGLVCGAFMAALAFIGNLFIGLGNLLIDVFSLIYNFGAEVANFFGNVFDDPIGAVCRLFFALADTVMGVLQALASAIDTIFGSNLAGSLQGWRDSLGGLVDSVFGKGEEVRVKMNADDYKLDRLEYGEAFDAGYGFGEGIDESISNLELSNLFNGNMLGSRDDANNIANTALNTSSMKDSLADTSEDLKYLRDVAETETINRYTTAQISVALGGVTNNVNSNMDIDGVVDYLVIGLNEAMEKAAEGVHE